MRLLLNLLLMLGDYLEIAIALAVLALAAVAAIFGLA